jgi:hypothetical protein
MTGNGPNSLKLCTESLPQPGQSTMSHPQRIPELFPDKEQPYSRIHLNSRAISAVGTLLRRILDPVFADVLDALLVLRKLSFLAEN